MPSAADSRASPLRRPRHDSSNTRLPESSSKRQKYTTVDNAKMASPTAIRTQKGLESSGARPSAFQPFAGAKKLVIKNLKTTQSPAREAEIREFYKRALEDISTSLDAVFVGETPPVPFEKLYRAVEDLCRKGDADEVAKVLKRKMKEHVGKVVLNRIERNGRASDVATAECLLGEWQNWNAQMTIVRSTFSYLDRTQLLREKYPSINDMTISYFREMAFPAKESAYPYSVGKKAVQALCELISMDRHGNGLDPVLLKGSIRMLNILGVYTQRFEPVFLEHSQPFLEEFGKSHESSSLKTYILACEKLLTREHFRFLEFNIDSMTEKRLMSMAHKTLIDDYTDKLLHRESLDKLLGSKDVETMMNLYELLKLSGIQKKLQEPWGGYIRDTAASIIRDKEKPEEQMVIRLLDLRRSLELMIRDAFAKDDDFLRAMRNAFSATMNDNTVANVWSIGTSKVGEMLAKHIDMLMRGGLKTLPAHLLSDVKDRAAAEREGQASTADEDAELDRQLDQALELFRFIEGKDTFEAFYKKDLARRLLMGRSASQDAERSMLTKLRSECGINFTHNLETMFKDQELAKDEMESFKDWLNADDDRKSSIDLQVMILSSSAWPSYPDVQINLPDEVATQMERYTRFYNSKHQGRRLTWKHCLGHCSLKARFDKATKELMVSAFQAVVLLLFNYSVADEFLSYEQISKSTGLKGTDLERTLQSLACGKARVLTKHPKGRDVNETDTFTFNRKFTHPNVRVKINQIQHKETKEENKATHERVAQDRRFETQAAIVRIMKSRKTMTYPELQAEVINMTKKRGSVEPAQIKKEIER